MEVKGKDPTVKKDSLMHRSQLLNYAFFLIGVMGLLLVFWYSGPFFNLVHSYGGNLTACFAFYFLIRPTAAQVTSSRVASALVALLVAGLFEATGGFFGMMTNIYDPWDYLANTLGVALAVVVDISVAGVSSRWRHGAK